MKTISKLESAGDAELVELCLGENRNAFASIIVRYQSLVCAIAYSACGDLGRSEDLAQDTFVTAWKRLRELKEPARLKSWLCGIARNLTNNSLRRDQRTPTALSDPLLPEVHSEGENPHEEAVSKEEEALVWRALEAIPEDYREPMILFYREGQSAQVVALALDLTEEAVWQRLSRGRVMLKAGVAKTVESALGRSVPGTAFTGAVLAALFTSPTSAKGAMLGAAAAKGGASAKSVAALGSIGGWFGMAGCLYFGMKALIENSKSSRERQFMMRMVWLRLATISATIVLVLGVHELGKTSNPLVHDPFIREVVMASAYFGVAVYSVVMFEMTHRRRRQIQIEDGTFVESDWMRQEKPRDLLSDAPGNNSKANIYKILAVGVGFTVFAAMAVDEAWGGHLIGALLMSGLLGIACFRSIRVMRWLPRFDREFRTLASGVGMCGVFTLFTYNFPYFHRQTGIVPWGPTEIIFNAVIVVVYAAFIGMLAWMRRRDSSKKA